MADPLAFGTRLARYVELLAAHDSVKAAAVMKPMVLQMVLLSDPGEDPHFGATEVLVQLAQCEAIYHSLAFLSARALRSSHSIISKYTKIAFSLVGYADSLEEGAQEMKDSDEVAKGMHVRAVDSAAGKRDSVESWKDDEDAASILRDLSSICELRVDMIQVYQQVATSSFPPMYSEFIRACEDILAKRTHLFDPETEGGLTACAVPLATQALAEAESLQQCFAAQVALSSVQYISTVVALQRATTAFDSWRSSFQLAQEVVSQYAHGLASAEPAASAKSSGSWWDVFSFSKDDREATARHVIALPPAHRWIELFIDTLTSKVTLYFSKLVPALAAQAAGTAPLGVPSTGDHVDAKGTIQSSKDSARGRRGTSDVGGAGDAATTGALTGDGVAKRVRRRVDFLSLLEMFVKRCEKEHRGIAVSIHLLLDASGPRSPAAHPLLGFRVPPTLAREGSDISVGVSVVGDADDDATDSDAGEEDAPLQGLKAYPSIFTFPRSAGTPASHWPNVVSLMMSISDEDIRNGHTLHHVESRLKTTYFLSPIEGSITMCLIFEGLVKSNDKLVKEFVRKMSGALRNTAIFDAVRPT